MYKGYQELCALPPNAYLNWQAFGMVLDQDGDEYATEQYDKGLKLGTDAKSCGGSVYIRANGTWAADTPNANPASRWAGLISSYEGIGYHRATKDLLHGFIDSGCKIVVYRYNKLTETVIQEATAERQYDER